MTSGDAVTGTAVVTAAHRSDYPDPISFRTGDTVTAGAEDTEYPGWIRVTTVDGNQGWAPRQYLLIQGESATALADYCARELDVDPGEEVHLLESLDGWARVRNTHGETGWIPENCLGIDQSR